MNWVEKLTTVVVPPASAAVLPLWNVSSSAPPPCCSCSMWQWLSTPPGKHQQPGGIDGRAALQMLRQGYDPAAAHADIGGEAIRLRDDGAAADDALS